MNKSLSYLMKIQGLPMEKIWGGAFLGTICGQGKAGGRQSKIGETWLLSTLAEGPSTYGGKMLPEVVGERGTDFWGKSGRLEYLVKFIDTSDNLSVQVHPGDEFARLHENSSGKTECWVVLGTSSEDAGVYLGFKEGQKREEFARLLQEGREDISNCLNFYQVKRGDFLYVPAGAIHAIGKGVLLLEVQQSSGITYRVWDWNRTDDQGRPRELHVEKAMQVINFDPSFNNELSASFRKNVFTKIDALAQTGAVLVDHPSFKVSAFEMAAGQSMTLERGKGERALGLICVQGGLQLSRGEESLEVEAWETVLAPFAGPSQLEVTSRAAGTQYILVS